MAGSLKTILGCVSAVGGTCTIGVPITFYSMSGRAANTNGVKLTFCDSSGASNNREEINFGDNSAKDICGNYAGDQSSLAINEDTEYTNLFQHNGFLGNQEWQSSSSSNYGTNQCIDGQSSPKGVALVDSSDVNNKHSYLGICNTQTGDKTKFIKRSPSSTGDNAGSELKLGTCSSECGESPEEQTDVKTLKQEKSNGGKEVKFYKSTIKLEQSDLKVQ